MNDIQEQLRRSLKRRPRQPADRFFGLASQREVDIIRGAAWCYPRPVRISDQDYAGEADGLSRAGYLTKVIRDDGWLYKLTPRLGHAKAVEMGALKAS